jgi:hypothetical protein
MVRGLELRIGKDLFPQEGSDVVYRLNKPFEGFTTLLVDRMTDSCYVGFITEKGFIGYGAEGKVVFDNGSIIRVVFESMK